MRSIRVRELLLVVALVALGLGWSIDWARLTRRLTEGSARSTRTADRFVEAEAVAEDLARRLAECEAAEKEAAREGATDVR